MQTLRLNHGTTDSHPTEEDTKASIQKVDRDNELHTCAESDHRMLPIVKCEKRSRTTCSRFHRLHSESNLACGGWAVGQHTLFACSLSTRCQKKKTHSLTLLLQNHLGHLSSLLLDLWHIHDLLSRVVTTANMCTSIRAVACRLYERCRRPHQQQSPRFLP